MVGSGATPSEWHDYTPRYDVIIKDCGGATPSEWYGHIPRCGVMINGHAARNPMLWYGHTPYCGVMINAMSCTILALWCDNKWLVSMQPHRGCTFDSPGLPTIGGYPGERGVWNATPLGVVLSFSVLSNASHVTIRGITSS